MYLNAGRSGGRGWMGGSSKMSLWIGRRVWEVGLNDRQVTAFFREDKGIVQDHFTVIFLHAGGED